MTTPWTVWTHKTSRNSSRSLARQRLWGVKRSFSVGSELISLGGANWCQWSMRLRLVRIPLYESLVLGKHPASWYNVHSSYQHWTVWKKTNLAFIWRVFFICQALLLQFPALDVEGFCQLGWGLFCLKIDLGQSVHFSTTGERLKLIMFYSWWYVESL